MATAIGLILRALEERLPALGRIIAEIAGAAWAIATFFVIPVVALEGTGPFRALQRSAAVVKARWGESATGAATIGVATFLISLAIALVGGVGGAALIAIRLLPLGAAVLAATVVAVIVVPFISSALSQIFRVANPLSRGASPATIRLPGTRSDPRRPISHAVKRRGR